MLTDRELVDALIINLKSWNWDIYNKMGIDEKTGKALVEEYTRLRRKGSSEDESYGV